jgi:hypothetical protein
MIKPAVVLFALSICFQAQAQTVKVVKVKGKRAIVETVSGNLMVGQTMSAGSGGGGGDDFDTFADSNSTGAPAGDHSGPRTHFVGGAASFSSAKASGSTKVTTTILVDAALYGWNPGNHMEYGLLASFGAVSGGGTSQTSMAGGGKFDWDFGLNKAPVQGLFSVGAEATFGQVSSSGVSASQINVFPMISYKWFILKTPTCVRFDAGMRMVMTSGSGTTKSTTDTNPGARVGLFTYF